MVIVLALIASPWVDRVRQQRRWKRMSSDERLGEIRELLRYQVIKDKDGSRMIRDLVKHGDANGLSVTEELAVRLYAHAFEDPISLKAVVDLCDELRDRDGCKSLFVWAAKLVEVAKEQSGS